MDMQTKPDFKAGKASTKNISVFKLYVGKQNRNRYRNSLNICLSKLLLKV